MSLVLGRKFLSVLNNISFHNFEVNLMTIKSISFSFKKRKNCEHISFLKCGKEHG